MLQALIEIWRELSVIGGLVLVWLGIAWIWGRSL